MLQPRFPFPFRSLLCVLFALASTGQAQTLPSSVEELDGELKRLREETEVPGMAAAVVINGRIAAAGASGVRKKGDPTAVTVFDKFDIGSCTKAMTASLAAVLVEEGKLKWTTTVGSVLNDVDMHPDFRAVTLTQLLSHRAGCPATKVDSLWGQLTVSNESGTEQRLKLVKASLANPPVFPPGNGYVYSNNGYVVAGLMMERVTGSSWEDLMKQRLFKPLGMDSAGFQLPASPGKVDQPWGHRGVTPIAPGASGRLPLAIGPAGVVHCSVVDWAKFARMHLLGTQLGFLKERKSYSMLHDIQNPAGNYALGWNVSGSGAAQTLTHNGTNGMWYSRIWMALEEKSAVMVACNTGSSEGSALCAKVIEVLQKKYRLIP